MKYINNAGLEFTVIKELPNKKCLIKFTKSGSLREVRKDNMLRGKVKDLYAPSRYGIGYDGDFIRVPYWKKAKDLWSNMLKRCYYKNDKHGYYGRCFVDKRWHCFANFLDDIKDLIGFNDWLNNRGMQLDKDYIVPGNVTYSKYTCCFLSEFKNKSIQPNYRIGKEFCSRTRTWVTTKS